MKMIIMMMGISLILSNLILLILLTGLIFYIISGKKVQYGGLFDRFGKKGKGLSDVFEEPHFDDGAIFEDDKEYVDRMKEEGIDPNLIPPTAPPKPEPTGQVERLEDYEEIEDENKPPEIKDGK